MGESKRPVLTVDDCSTIAANKESFGNALILRQVKTSDSKVFSKQCLIVKKLVI